MNSVKLKNLQITASIGLLTNFMEHIPSWEADSHSASKEIPRL